jgi:virulence factor Mce-like protein
MRGGRAGALAASPTLVGAVTVLVVVVAVFLSYQANQGLPFVPTYKVSAEIPSAQSLVRGNEVRIGGQRVGQITAITPETIDDAPCPGDPERECTTQIAKVDMELVQDLDPLPDDSTLTVRARSALGLKYLELHRGSSDEGFEQGATIPVTQSTPEPIEIDQVFNTFDDPTRAAIQSNLVEFGNALAGRGQNLNAAIGDLRPLVERLEPVMRNLAAPDTGLSRFVSALSAAAAEAAPVAEIQGQLFADLETTFAAFADVARPYIQESIEKGPVTEDVTIATLPTIRPFLANTAVLFNELRPGFAAIRPPISKAMRGAITNGVPALRLSPEFNAQIDPTAQALLDFNNNADVRTGITSLTTFSTTFRPFISFVAPAQAVCNYASLLFRNLASLSQYGDGLGTFQRVIVLGPPDAPNSESGPSSAPASGGEPSNFLHYNPYPNTAAPGQEFECEAGNEDYAAGGVVIGNEPGNQGIDTAEQLVRQKTGKNKRQKQKQKKNKKKKAKK